MEAVDRSVVAEDERWAVPIDEAARRLGIGRAVMYREAKARTYPTIRIGQRVVIPMGVINDWLTNGYDPDGESEKEDGTWD